MPLDPFNVSVKIRWSRRTAEAPAFAQRILTDTLNGSKSTYRPTDLLGRRVSCNGSFQRINATSTDIKSTDIKFYAKKPSSFTVPVAVADVGNNNNANANAANQESTGLINKAHMEEAPLRFMGQDVFYYQPLSLD